jgi:hypothetical protein
MLLFSDLLCAADIPPESGTAATELFIYFPAYLFIKLPADSECFEQDESWTAFSLETAIMVRIIPMERYVPPQNLSEWEIIGPLGTEHLDDFRYVGSTGDQSGVMYAYGTAGYIDGDGDYREGYVGILENSLLKDRSFVMVIMMPSLRDEQSRGAAQTAVTSLFTTLR